MAGPPPPEPFASRAAPLPDRHVDPGWAAVVREIGWGLVPGLQVRRFRQLQARGGLDGLSALRALTITFMNAVVLIGVVVAVMGPGGGGDAPVGPAVAALAVLGAACAVAAARLRRPLDCSGDRALAGGYRSELFIRFAVAEVPALVGFVAFMVVGRPVLYYVAAVFSLAAFVGAAPTSRNLSRTQDRLRLARCPRSLVAALRDPRG